MPARDLPPWFPDDFAADPALLEATEPGPAILQYAPDSITAQALELSGAWKTELRAPDGRWVHGAGTADYFMNPDTGEDMDIPLPPEPGTQDAEAHAAAVKFFGDAAQKVPGLLGGGKESFTGRVELFSKQERPWLDGVIDWNGNISYRDGLAKSLKTDQENPGSPVDDPNAYDVVLHELIHGVIPEGTRYGDNAAEYQDENTGAIEEGFTELGTIHHAPEFLDAMGIGNRPTAILSADKYGSAVDNPAYRRGVDALVSDMQKKWASMSGDIRAPYVQAAHRLGYLIEELKSDPGSLPWGEGPLVLTQIQHLGDPGLTSWALAMQKKMDKAGNVPVMRHDTLSEYAGRLRDPRRIYDGESWGHYPWQTRLAQKWVQEVAKAEGHGDLTLGTPGWQRVRELADEINRQGAAGKVSVMADQVARASGVKPVSGLPGQDYLGPHGHAHPPGIMTPDDWNALEDAIRAKWKDEETNSFIAARRLARTRAEERRIT